MAVPSSLYAEDENARQTLPNGTILKWSRKNSVIYPTANVETDRSICYTNWDDPIMTKANRGFHQWQPGVSAVYPDMGTNSSEGYGYLKAAGIQQQNPQPRIENLFCGVVLSDGAGNYVWGYNPEQENCINTGGGADRRYLLDMDINKMIFSATINAYLVSDMENIDYASNPSTTHLPSTQSITLKQLYDDPDKYYISSFTVGNCYVYGETGNDHWRTASIRPAILLHSPEHTGQFYGDAQYSVFGQFYSHGVFSYDSRNIANHPVFQGGASSMPVYNLMSSGYCIGCDDELKFEPTVYDYPSAGSQATTNALFYWGQSTSWGHYSYINAETWNYGVSVYWAAYGARVNYNVNTSESVYTEFRFDGRRLLKGSTVLSFFASFGLYFMSESFDPDSANLTPETLGDDSRIMLGEMSADGTTTGRWITDIDSYTGPNKDGKTSNPDYNPSGGGGSVDDEDNTDPVNTTGAPFASGICNYYAMTAGSPLLSHISEALGAWDIANTSKDLYKNLISCKLVKPPAPIPTTGSAPFTIYGVKPQYAGADISLPVVSGNPEATFGPYQISRKFNDFRDYAPYTRVSIYLPYCGWCDLPSHVVGRQVSVKYFTDIIAATCKAVVFCGNNIVAEAAGGIGLDIPFAADNVGAKMQAVTAGMIAALGGGIQLGAGIGTMVSTKSGSGAKAALSGASQYLSGYSQMAMAFNENTTEISGKNGDGCCLSGATNIIIKIVRPKKGAYTDAPYTPPGYGHNIGYVSQKQVKVSSVSGLLIADNVDTSGISGATEAERAEIKRVLETGLIVNAAPE